MELDYSEPDVSTHVAEHDLSDADYSALVESLLDDEDDVEAEFSMLKCYGVKGRWSQILSDPEPSAPSLRF